MIKWKKPVQNSAVVWSNCMEDECMEEDRKKRLTMVISGEQRNYDKSYLFPILFYFPIFFSICILLFQPKENNKWYLKEVGIKFRWAFNLSFMFEDNKTEGDLVQKGFIGGEKAYQKGLLWFDDKNILWIRIWR